MGFRGDDDAAAVAAGDDEDEEEKVGGMVAILGFNPLFAAWF